MAGETQVVEQRVAVLIAVPALGAPAVEHAGVHDARSDPHHGIEPTGRAPGSRPRLQMRLDALAGGVAQLVGTGRRRPARDQGEPELVLAARLTELEQGLSFEVAPALRGLSGLRLTGRAFGQLLKAIRKAEQECGDRIRPPQPEARDAVLIL